MNSGKLRHRITIQTYVETLADDGSTSRTWSTYAQRWAAWKQVAASEIQNQGEAVEGRVRHEFMVRNTDGVTTDMRISYDSRVFNITGVTADPTDNKSQVITCTEVAEVV